MGINTNNGGTGDMSSDVKWIKIVTDIFDDEKMLLIESLPSADSIIVIWFKLLCLAGKNNNDGVFLLNDRIAYTDEMLSTIFRRDINTIRLALNTFEEFGMIEIVQGVITIPNWGKHQTLDKIEKRNEYMKNYMKGYRQKQRKKIECKDNNEEEPNGESNDKSNRKLNGELNSEPNVNSLEKDNKDNKDNKEKYKKEKVFLSSYIFSESEIVQSAFNDFLAMRNAMKKPMTERAIVQLRTKLESLSSDEYTQADILDQSTFKTWQDIYPLAKDFVSVRKRPMQTVVNTDRYADYQ